MMTSRPSATDLAGHFSALSLRNSSGRPPTAPSPENEAAAAAMAIRSAGVGRKKEFKHMERVKGRLINVLQGLELHTGVFSAAEQRAIVDAVYDLQEKGRRGRLRERTYSEPKKWMKGKGRVTLQFGCCYNYAVDKNGNPPGILRDEEVDPIPPLLKQMIRRMVSGHVLPPTCIPNSCIVNIYDREDCIPPHIDHHDFLRPFCTVSFLSECDIVFGAELKVIGPGEFAGSSSISLPLGSVLVLSGNAADVAKHCVPAVPAKRISITFRKMDEAKLPYDFVLDPDLQNLRPLPLQRKQLQNTLPFQQDHHHHGQPLPKAQLSQKVEEERKTEQVHKVQQPGAQLNHLKLSDDDFPSLAASMRGPARSGRR